MLLQLHIAYGWTWEGRGGGRRETRVRMNTSYPTQLQNLSTSLFTLLVTLVLHHCLHHHTTFAYLYKFLIAVPE